MEPFFQVLLFFGIGLPTIIFYGWIVIFAGLWGRESHASRSKSSARVYGALALAPLIWYGATFAGAFVRVAQHAGMVWAGEWLPKLHDAPRVLVLYGARADWQDHLVEMGAFDVIYVSSPARVIRLENVRRPGCDAAARGNMRLPNIHRARMGFLVCATETKADSVPIDGLHYNSVPPPPVHGRFAWRSYYELKMIEGGRERQVGFNGTPLASYPMIPPVVSSLGFLENEFSVSHIVPWHGDIPFLFGRLGLDASKLKPHAQPAAEEVRAEYLRRRDSAEFGDQIVASYIATAVGASVLSADDIAPILKTRAIDTDLGREVGFQQFCGHINRLCDRPEQLTAACLSQRGFTPERAAADPASFRRCKRLPLMCNWCASTALCQPDLDGKTEGCTKADQQARDKSLDGMRENREDLATPPKPPGGSLRGRGRDHLGIGTSPTSFGTL
jgi:hypothetical protein